MLLPLVLGLWYLIAANAVVASSYRLSDTLEEKSDLARTMDTLKANIAATTNPQALEARAQELGFKPVTRPSYLPVPGTSVARR